MGNSKKVKEISFMEIDEQRIRTTCNIYFHWKQLDTELRTISTRGCNFPGELSENFVCYCFGFCLNKVDGGDCYDRENDRVIEVKCSSSDTTDDLSSFSPKETFDDLIFCKVDKNEDCIYFYDTHIGSNELKKIKINKTQSVEDQQKEGRRPRFSVYKQIVLENNLQPILKFSIRDKEVIKL